MNTRSRSDDFPSAAGFMRWTLNMATRLLAHQLNMPEPLVHTTGAFVFAQVAAAESSVGRKLCPIPAFRLLRSRLRRLTQ
jgi:hypothetical protein